MNGPTRKHSVRARGFTLIELLTALLILSMLALMSYRGLDAVLDTRTKVLAETTRWQRTAAFFSRFERDVGMAAAISVRTAAGAAPAWIGRSTTTPEPRLELSRAASTEGSDSPRRIGYRLNELGEVELWIWAGLDLPPGHVPVRYPLLTDVATMDIDYLDSGQAWVPAWPAAADAAPLPRAVRLRLAFNTGEEIVRVFAVHP